MPVLLHDVSQCLLPCGRAGEYLQLAATIIADPLDAPLAGGLAIFKDFGWFRHGGVLRLPRLTRPAPLPRQDRARRPPWLWRRVGLWPWWGGRQPGEDGA